MKKRWLVTLMVMTLVLSLTVPSAAFFGFGDDDEDEPTKITYWTTQVESSRLEVIKGLAKKFTEETGIEVKVVPVEENDFSTKLSAAQAGNKLPQVMEMGVQKILRLGNAGLLDIEAAGDVINSYGRDDFYQGPLEMTQVANGDGNYAVPFHGWVQGIWYREDWFEEAGLEAPTNWENILKAAKHFHKPDQKQYGIIFGTKKDAYARQTFTQFALSNDARVFNEEGELVYNSPEMLETYKYLKDLANYTQPGPETWRDGRNLFLNDQVAMMFYSTYIMSDLVGENMVEKTGFASKMEHSSAATFGQVVGLSITSTNSDAKEEAAKKFVKFLHDKKNYIEFLHMAPGGMNPVRKSIAQSKEYKDNKTISVYGDKATEIASGLDNIGKFGFVGGKVFPKMGDIGARYVIGDSINQMTERDWEAQKALDYATNKMKEIVNE
ncbi:ABC transporter substrate-binding protein [Halanaerobacter jeridensis]|uniref:Multiple sugar transport system substrate-binding protein n=1 Tax=Halanaerobacter jeridensis TaxID=706427 RepID=A0A938XWP5_9FIRM|nr:sugar ABC transporter substrate-binding protein [Halanaerobacter jeridensis]MBM7557027.1 multiple sugar transport system substrate-binding protein [Halanaerobacter jeridensis]